MPEDAQVHQRLVMAKLTNQESHKRNHKDGCCPTNPGCAEPVVLLPFIEDDLQAAQPHSQQSQPDTVKLPGMGVFYVWGVFHVAGNHKHSKNADWNIDVEGPTPGVRIGKPSTKRGPQDRRNYHS